MRIEPTTKSLPHQAANRRPRADAVDRAKKSGKDFLKDNSPALSREVLNEGMKGYDIVGPDDPHSSALRRLSSSRWRAYVPFIAQYIGQETAIETPERWARRHSEFAWKAYNDQAASIPRKRLISQV